MSIMQTLTNIIAISQGILFISFLAGCTYLVYNVINEKLTLKTK